MDHDHDIRLGCAGEGPSVGGYGTLYGAVLAVRQLERSGFRAADVRIVPAGLAPHPRWRRRVERDVLSMSVVVVTVLVLLATSAFLSGVTSWSAMARWASSAMAAAAAGGIAARVGSSHAANVRRRARQDRRLVATRFDVHCARDPRRAAHVLAGWWDPEAVPAPERPLLVAPPGPRSQRETADLAPSAATDDPGPIAPRHLSPRPRARVADQVDHTRPTDRHRQRSTV